MGELEAHTHTHKVQTHKVQTLHAYTKSNTHVRTHTYTLTCKVTDSCVHNHPGS